MRNFVSAALCGLMLHAPAMAQDSAAGTQPSSEEMQVAEQVIASDVSVEAKPDGVDSIETVGPVAGFTYFHRTGATLADQRADLAACRPEILAMAYVPPPSPTVTSSYGATTVYVPPPSQPMTPGAAAGVGVGAVIAVAAIEAARLRAAELRSMQLNYENCMLVRGWRVMTLDSETGAQLDRLNERRLAERLDVIVGATSPQGTLARQFDNAHKFRAADDIDEMSLSLRFLPANYFSRELRSGNNMLNATSRREERERALRARERAEQEAERARIMQEAFVGRPDDAATRADLGALGGLPEGSALVLVESGAPILRFVRMNLQDGDGASVITVAPTDGIAAFVAPAGDWRLVSMAPADPATSFCLGAPVLHVSAGDVIFAGSFGIDGAADFSTEDARSQLSSLPQWAERLQAGSYTNGSTFDCGEATFVTAYEITDAPFIDGYAYGSRATGSAVP